MYCKNCGTEISPNAVSCPKCGEPQRQLLNKSVFIVLAVFLGWLGIHRFYSKDYALGILYLIFWWTFIPYFVSIVEAVVIGLRKNDPRFEQ